MKSLRNRSVILPLLGLAILLGGAVPARTEPVAQAERIPVDVRRITLLVRDTDKSLPLYRDALGLKVIYDELIGATTDPAGKTTPPTTRLVLLRANDHLARAYILDEDDEVKAMLREHGLKPLEADEQTTAQAEDQELRDRLSRVPGFGERPDLRPLATPVEPPAPPPAGR